MALERARTALLGKGNGRNDFQGKKGKNRFGNKNREDKEGAGGKTNRTFQREEKSLFKKVKI